MGDKQNHESHLLSLIIMYINKMKSLFIGFESFCKLFDGYYRFLQNTMNLISLHRLIMCKMDIYGYIYI